jgi:septal ring factor EnvC (AmiA/AmiB activator)
MCYCSARNKDKPPPVTATDPTDKLEQMLAGFMTAIQQSNAKVSTDIGGVKADIGSVKEDIGRVQADINSVRTDLKAENEKLIQRFEKKVKRTEKILLPN